MRRTSIGALVLSGVMFASTSFALELKWYGGGTDISVSVATRCTLELSPGAGVSALPPRWRLAWVADSCGIDPRPLSCGSEVARPTHIGSETTLAALLENRDLALFCSSPVDSATSAWFAVDIPATCAGKFKVVALDPDDPDSNRVLQSSVATFNSGCGRPFPPIVLRAATTHESTEYLIEAVGSDLGSATAATLQAHDATWNADLSIESLTDTSVTVSAAFAAVVPACFLQIEADSEFIATRELPAESAPPLGIGETQGGSCQESFRERMNGFLPGQIQPKDFAFVPGGWTAEGIYVFHLFYIRQNQFTKLYPELHGGLDFTEKNIGHAVSNDVNLEHWFMADSTRDSMAIAVRPGMFDSKHVWAPHILRRGVTYYMFYTGVDSAGDQRMGLATSTDLFNWTQQEEPILDEDDLGDWVEDTFVGFQGQVQLRDAYVMPDPAVPGDWLMYYVSVHDAYPNVTTGGYSRSHGDLGAWEDSQPLRATHFSDTVRTESPHVFERQGKWWLLYTAVVDVNPSVFAITHPSDPSDTTAANWTAEGSINDLVIDEFTGQPSGAYSYWKGSELLEISAANDIAFLAAYNDQVVGISYIPVRSADSPYLFEEHCPVSALSSPAPESPRGEFRLSVKSIARDGSRVVLLVDNPGQAEADIGVFDVAGRRIATVARSMLPAGRSEFVWDPGRGPTGRASSGMYFASARVGGAMRSVVFPVLR